MLLKPPDDAKQNHVKQESDRTRWNGEGMLLTSVYISFITFRSEVCSDLFPSRSTLRMSLQTRENDYLNKN